MKLATRLSAFFLAALAIILIGNSIALFVIARLYLYRQFDDQLRSSLNTIVAAIEVEDDDVKWEPSDHTVNFGSESGAEGVRWVVVDEEGAVVARSTNLILDPGATPLIEHAGGKVPTGALSPWRYLTQRLAAPHPKPVDERMPLERAALTVLVARRLSDLTTTLNWLAIALVVLPLLCWIVAELLGQAYCQRAIRPVREMAQSAHAIRAKKTADRLEVPASKDELEELGNAFNQLLDQLFSAFEQQRRFAGDAAHQLRTPLTVLQGQVEVALRRERTSAEYRSTLQVVQEEVAAFRQTVETLLLLAQPDAMEAVHDAQVLNLEAWLSDYRQRWKSSDRLEDIELDVKPNLTHCGSPALLSQLLDVLVSNAIKYSPQGSPIYIRAFPRGEELTLEVEDHGSGIASQDLEAIFQPFFRSRKARQSGRSGTGLGLAIAERIATALGGRIVCDSTEGKGSCFSCFLPPQVDPRDANRT